MGAFRAHALVSSTCAATGNMFAIVHAPNHNTPARYYPLPHTVCPNTLPTVLTAIAFISTLGNLCSLTCVAT
jgi:hypothetical protein